MYSYYRYVLIWINHLNRTDAIVVMVAGMALGTYFLRGLSTKWH